MSSTSNTTNKNNTIKAKVVADSVNQNDTRITTVELEYHRYVHSELMTHRVFSRNSSSSRAIPITTMLDTILMSAATPVHWGKNQAGMQAKEELQGENLDCAKEIWEQAKRDAVSHSRSMHQVGVHKQIANRLTEPFQMIKVVVTSTEWNNFFWLRKHPDAPPEIAQLANCIYEARFDSTPIHLKPGEWHLPYVSTYRNAEGVRCYTDDLGSAISIREALMISASCCAQVSYRKNDGSLEKAETIYKRLIESEPCHASPVEHQAQAFDSKIVIAHAPNTWTKGLTHVDRDSNLWSGNFRDFIQYRQMLPGNAKKG